MIDEGAAEGDVHSGDRVLRVAGAPVVSWDDIRARVAQAGDVVDLDVERDGSVVHVTRSKRTGGKLGISPAMHHESASAASVVTNGAVEPLRVVVLAVRTIFTSREKADLAGPIGIARVVATSPTEGARIAATATAMWNTALCLLSMVVALALVPRGALKAKAT